MRSGSGAVLVPLLTMGASADSARLRVTRVAGIVIAVLNTRVLLYFSTALASRLIFTGIRNIMFGGVQ